MPAATCHCSAWALRSCRTHVLCALIEAVEQLLGRGLLSPLVALSLVLYNSKLSPGPHAAAGAGAVPCGAFRGPRRGKSLQRAVTLYVLLPLQDWEKVSSTKKFVRFHPPAVKAGIQRLQLAGEHLRVGRACVGAGRGVCPRHCLWMPRSKRAGWLGRCRDHRAGGGGCSLEGEQWS